MAFFEWKDEYSVGIHRIDLQHMEILRLMNDLYDEIRTGTRDESIKRIFVELLKYANYHFGLELKLFEKYHYDKERLHFDEHNFFIEKVKELMISQYLSSRSVALETLHFLRGWFEKHMMGTDREYCAYFAFKKWMDEIDRFLESDDAAYHISVAEL